MSIYFQGFQHVFFNYLSIEVVRALIQGLCVHTSIGTGWNKAIWSLSQTNQFRISLRTCFCLSSPSPTTPMTTSTVKQVTSLTWNASGSTVAVGYGRFDHTDWCTHSAAVSTWNLDRRTVTEDKADVTIDVGCCVTSLTFHPSNPALLLGGTFNGQ